MSARRWCFTNYNMHENYDMLKAESGCKYIIIGLEICPNTGRPHHQGFIKFDKVIRMERLMRLIPGAHVEKAMRSDKINIEYCKKDGEFGEWGEPGNNQGRRNDIEEVKVAVNSGHSMKRIAEHCNSYQALRYAETLMKYKEKKRNWVPEVYWYYGESGVGKTRTAVEEAGDEYWMSGRNLKWWEGYDGEENIIIDDFRGDFCTFHELLRILDRYEYRIEVKGSSRQLLAKKIWITTTKRPEGIYINISDEDIKQLLRRITVIREIVTVTEVGGNTKRYATPDDKNVRDYYDI